MQFRNDFISNDEALERILADIETDPYMEQAINDPEISVITPPMETSQNCGTKRQGSRSSSPINLRSNNKHAKTNTENSLWTWQPFWLNNRFWNVVKLYDISLS